LAWPSFLRITSAVGFSHIILKSNRSINEIRAAAFESNSKCENLLPSTGKAWSPPEFFDKGEFKIPSVCWSDAIKELKPVRVYNHRLNVAIVLNLRDGIEEGIYFMNTFSSYGPITRFQDGFEFGRNPTEPHLYYFRRNIRSDKKVN
jgi:hypothetical protein